MSVAVRFAPSPTGRLHVGNARIALANWLFARKAGGRFVLRFDDTDPERSEETFLAACEEDLAWLGLDWQIRVRQSERRDSYLSAFERLAAAGRVYACYETPDELAAARKRRLAKGLAPIYDRAALRLGAAERAGLEAAGRAPHWRFRLGERAVEWVDLVRGPVAVAAGSASDPVIRRADGGPTYALASVIDDIEFGITHVIRGEDHVSNTPVQIELFRALEARCPAFGHLALLTGPGGESLSKRLEGESGAALSLAALRERGVEPLALASMLARLGTADPIVPRLSLDDLAERFDLARCSRAQPRFDADDLMRLNHQLLLAMPFEQAAPRLAAIGLEDADEAFWLAVRANLAVLADARAWWRVCRGRLDPVIEDRDYLAKAAALLPAEGWDETTWEDWTRKLGAATGRRGRALYHPLRLALTACERGPELKNLLPVIGRDRALARLEGHSA